MTREIQMLENRRSKDRSRADPEQRRSKDRDRIDQGQWEMRRTISSTSGYADSRRTYSEIERNREGEQQTTTFTGRGYEETMRTMRDYTDQAKDCKRDRNRNRQRDQDRNRDSRKVFKP
jgi:hypothetical protein